MSASRRRNPEELRLEAIHLIQKPAKAGSDFAGRVRVWIVVGAGIPPIRRDFPNAAAPLAQQPPELLGVYWHRLEYGSRLL